MLFVYINNQPILLSPILFALFPLSLCLSSPSLPSPTPFPSHPLSFLLYPYLQVNYIVSVYSDYPQSAYIYLASVITKIYGGDTKYSTTMSELITFFTSHITPSLVNPSFFDEQPGVIQDFYTLVARFIEYMPDYYLSFIMPNPTVSDGSTISPFTIAFISGIAGLRTAHPSALSSLVMFYTYAFRQAIPGSRLNIYLNRDPTDQIINAMRSLLQEHGVNIVYNMTLGMMGKRNPRDNDELVSLVDALLDFAPEGFLLSFQQVLSHSDLSMVSPDARQELISAMKDASHRKSEHRQETLANALVRFAEISGRLKQGT